MGAKTVGVISIKGGVGKTTTVSNLAASLANEFKKKVLVVDANFSAPNLGLHLGIIEDTNTIHNVLRGRKDIKDVIFETEHGFDMIPAALNTSNVQHLQLKKHLQKVKEDYDIILIDSSPNLNDEVLATMIASDELLVVTTPDYPTLSCTLNAVRVAKQKNTPITGLVLNKVYNKKYELTHDDVQQTVEVPIIAQLRHEETFAEALAQTKPAVSHKKTDATIEYHKLAASLIGEQYYDPRILSRVGSLFSKPRAVELNRRQLYQS